MHPSSSRRACPLALLLATLPVVAQEVPLPEAPHAEPVPAVQPVETPAPQPVHAAPDETPPTQPATRPATQPAAAGPGTTTVIVPSTQTTRPYDPNARVSFNFRDATADSVLDYLSESLGFVIIKEGRIEGRITIASRQAVSANEAVELLNTVLRPLNYTAIRSGRALRVVPRDKAKKANIPVRFGSNPEDIKDTDELITQVIPLGQVDAVRLRQDLQPLFSPDADVTANSGSNTIIITDSSSSIRRIAQIVYGMDRHMASTTDIKVFQLQYASASTTARLINDVFRQDTGTGGQQGGQGRNAGQFPGFGAFGGFNPGGFRGFGGAAPGGQGGGAPAVGADGTRAAGKVTASADDRTNTLVVSGPSPVLKVIEGVIKELDSNPAQASTVFVYRLRNGQAARLQSVLNSLFGTGGGSTTGSSNLQRSPFGTTSTNRTATGGGLGGGGLGGGGLGGLGGAGGFGGFGNTGGFGGAFGGNTANRGLAGLATGNTGNLSPQARAIASELVGQVYVVADADTNSLIITTSPKYKEKVEQLLADLDRAVPQVLIKVLIAEVTHTNSADLGVDINYLSLNTGNGNRIGVGTDMGAGAAAAQGGLNVGYVEGNFSAALHALATEGKADVLSRPYILASDNQLSSILVGQNFPFVTNSRTTDTGQTINTVQYQDIGIILNVTPHINPDGKVIMDVAPEISSLSPDQSVQISPGVFASVFNKRSAQSRVAIDNGKTIVIGGLMEDRKDTTIRKVPLLGDIPVVGNLFRRTQDSKRKTELLIFLTPHVVVDSSVLPAQSKDEMRGVKIVPDAVAPGMFQDHMQGMTRGATTAPTEPLYVPPSKK